MTTKRRLSLEAETKAEMPTSASTSCSDCSNCSDCSSVPAQPMSEQKRPRTHHYQREKAIYEDVLRSCRILQQELARLREDGGVRVLPKRLATIQSTEASIQNQLNKYQQRFQTCCVQLKEEANQTIHLSYGFDSLSRAIDDMEKNKTTSTTACVLPMLNTGHETTTAMKRLIAEYAGVASSAELDDVKTLKLKLHTNNQ